MNTQTHNLNAIDKIIVFGIFLDWLTYENVLFLEPNVAFGKFSSILIYSYKLFFPFFLIAYTGLPPIKLFRKASSAIYIFSFTLFIFWGLIPTLISGVFTSWAKLIPVFILFISCLSFFSKKPAAFILYSKFIILYVLSALSQYVLVYTFKTFESPNELGLVGPFGLFGNINGIRFLPLFDIPFVRLTGFWREPSNAAGSAFAAFF